MARSGDQPVSSSSTHAMQKLLNRVMSPKRPTRSMSTTLDERMTTSLTKSAKHDFINEERAVDNSIGEESTTNNKFDEESITNGKIEEESVRRKRVDEDAVKKDEAARSAMSRRSCSKNPFIQRSQSGECTKTAPVQTISSDAESVEYKNLSFIV